MNSVRSRLRKLLCGSENGATLVEYALSIFLVALSCVAVITVLGGSLADQYDDLAQVIADPSQPNNGNGKGGGNNGNGGGKN